MEKEIDVQAVMDDKSVPFWVKDVLRAGVVLDPVDFARWSDVIAEIARQRADRATARALNAKVGAAIKNVLRPAGT